MSFLKPLALVALSISGLLANPAFANCTGSGNFYSCYDARSGNSYNVQKYGNSTSVQGYNPGTGNSWSQQSYNYGNTTNTYGTASNGSSWNQTTTPYGTYGTDSRGNSFYAPRR